MVNEYASVGGGGPSAGYSGAGGGSPGSDYTTNWTSMADAAAATVTGGNVVAGQVISGSYGNDAAYQAAVAASEASKAAGGQAANFNPVGTQAWYDYELAHGSTPSSTLVTGSQAWWDYQIGLRDAAARSNTALTPVSKSTPGYYEYYAPTYSVGTPEWYSQIAEAKINEPTGAVAQTPITVQTPGYFDYYLQVAPIGSAEWYSQVSLAKQYQPESSLGKTTIDYTTPGFFSYVYPNINRGSLEYEQATLYGQIQGLVPRSDSVLNQEMVPGMYLTDIYGVMSRSQPLNTEIYPGVYLQTLAPINLDTPDVVQTSREHYNELYGIPLVSSFISDTYKTSKAQGEKQTLVPETAMIFSGLKEASDKISEQISKIGESGYALTGSLPTREAKGYGNVLVGFGTALAQTAPFIASIPYGLEWVARNPSAVPSKTTETLFGMGKGILEREAISPGSAIGTGLGMYVGGKVSGKVADIGYAKAAEYSPISIRSVEVPTGKTIVPSATESFYSSMFKNSPIIKGTIEQFGLVNEFEPANKYVYAKVGYGENPTILGGVAWGSEVKPSVFIGRSGAESIMGKTHIEMPTEFAKYAPVEWTVGQRELVSPFIEKTAATGYEKALITMSTDLARSERNLKYEPYQPVGMAPQEGVSFETSLGIQTALGRAGAGSITVGSRSMVDLFGEKYFRDVYKSDIDISASIMKQGTMFKELKSAYVDTSIQPRRSTIWDVTLKEQKSNMFEVPESAKLKTTLPEKRGFSFGEAGKEHTLGVHPLEYNVDVKGMPVRNIAGEYTWIQTPENAILTKLSRVAGAGTKAEKPAAFIYSPSTKVTSVKLTGGKKLSDLADIYAITRGISATAYKQRLYDIGKIFETKSNAIAERLKLEKTDIKDIVKEDILKDVPKAPPRIGNILGVGLDIGKIPEATEYPTKTKPSGSKPAGGLSIPILPPQISKKQYPSSIMQNIKSVELESYPSFTPQIQKVTGIEYPTITPVKTMVSEYPTIVPTGITEINYPTITQPPEYPTEYPPSTPPTEYPPTVPPTRTPPNIPPTTPPTPPTKIPPPTITTTFNTPKKIVVKLPKTDIWMKRKPKPLKHKPHEQVYQYPFNVVKSTELQLKAIKFGWEAGKKTNAMKKNVVPTIKMATPQKPMQQIKINVPKVSAPKPMKVSRPAVPTPTIRLPSPTPQRSYGMRAPTMPKITMNPLKIPLAGMSTNKKKKKSSSTNVRSGLF